MRPGVKRELRIFGFGAAWGFLGGVLAVAAVLWHYGPPATVAERSAAVDRVLAADRPPGGLAGVDDSARHPPRAAATSGRISPAPSADAHVAPAAPSPDDASAVRELEARDLAIPVEGVRPDQLVRSFADSRTGSRTHEAIDILAPRNTPVLAAEDGRVVKLFNSKAGGITIYQFDPSERFCYYYAHLERYAEGLHEGDRVTKGQRLGYVGTSGNAPENTPHLHFAVFRLTADRRWWEGAALDPYDILR